MSSVVCDLYSFIFNNLGGTSDLYVMFAFYSPWHPFLIEYKNNKNDGMQNKKGGKFVKPSS